MGCESIRFPTQSINFEEIEKAFNELPKRKKRVPRKLKKEFKILWSKKYGVKIKIERASIKKTIWDCGIDNSPTWGCKTYPFNDKK